LPPLYDIFVDIYYTQYIIK